MTVQPKLSIKLDVKNNLLIPVAEKGEYILKPQTQTFPNIPENEQCCMDIAHALEIDVPLHCLIQLKDESWAYVVKRFDRKGKKKIHQEDFAQILERKDRYQGSVEQIGRKLWNISSIPGLDTQLFFERVILNFLIGNGDAHLKAGLVGPSETIPVIDFHLGLSRWQNIFFCEFDGPRTERRVVCTLIPDADQEN